MKKRDVRYGNLKRIGRGVMGVVYRADDLHLQRQVAVKLIAPEYASRDDIGKRFLNEARLAARLRHPNICPVFDIGRSDDGIPYLTMPLLQGRTLDRYVATGREISIKSAVRLVRVIASAMQAAHDNGVVHRDLKPGNIMIQDGQPIVMDFGLALQTDADCTRLTSHGQQLGSPAYMSPEQIEGDLTLIGPKTDIYALGVILFEMLTGRPPFVGTLTSIFKQILIDDAPQPSEFRTGCAELDRICAKAMAKNPEDRFESMRDFADALKELNNKCERRGWGPFPMKPLRRTPARRASKTVVNASQRTKADAARPRLSKCVAREIKKGSWRRTGKSSVARPGRELTLLALFAGFTVNFLRTTIRF